MAHQPVLTAERLRQFLEYDPETGEFRWIIRGKGRWRQKVGTLRPDGRVQIGVERRHYLAHDLVWLWVTGTWPSLQIDHENENPRDNRFSNLRLATPSQNTSHRGALSNNTSGLVGAFWHKTKKRWKGQIDGKHLGYFATREQAHEAYRKAALEMYGEFAHHSLKKE